MDGRMCRQATPTRALVKKSIVLNVSGRTSRSACGGSFFFDIASAGLSCLASPLPLPSPSAAALALMQHAAPPLFGCSLGDDVTHGSHRRSAEARARSCSSWSAARWCSIWPSMPPVAPPPSRANGASGSGSFVTDSRTPPPPRLLVFSGIVQKSVPGGYMRENGWCWPGSCRPGPNGI
eukprot:365001-Chlamydomonas_euryale.AAC.6